MPPKDKPQPTAEERKRLIAWTRGFLDAEAIARAGVEPFYLPSGAGHDAEQFGGVTDIGMLFVRCGNGGISHSPLETVTAADADVGARVLLDVLLNLN